MISSLAGIIRPGLPRTRVTFQLSGVLAPRAGGSDSLLRDVVATAIAWVQDKFPEPLPARARDAVSFVAEVPGQEARCIALPEHGAWALRLVQPDAPHAGQPAVAGRTWLTDVALRAAGDGVRVGIRVRCSSLPYAREEARLDRPRLVAELASRFRLMLARELTGEPWRMTSPADLLELHALLTSPGRLLPVYVLTQPDSHRLGVSVPEFLLDEVTLARRCLGIAHVVTLPPAATFEWTKLVGKSWSAFLGAVRTYRPGLSFADDAPTDHPLIMAERVLAFRYGGHTGEHAFAEFLVDQAQRHVATMQLDWGGLLFLEDATLQQAASARRHAADESTRQTMSAEQEAAFNAKIERLESDVGVWQAMAEEAQHRQLRAEDENRRLKARMERMRRVFAEHMGRSAEALIALPESFDEFESWVEDHLGDRLVLHPRAGRGLKEATYRDVPLAARALLLLAGPYFAMQTGHPGAHQEFEAGLKELGLQFRKSIAEHRAREEGAAYFVHYPTQRDGEQFLAWHLTKGSGKDPRHCLRVYFFWHEATQRVVVGWLPSHLDNRMT